LRAVITENTSYVLYRMTSSGKWRRVGLVRADGSEERITSINRALIISTLMMEAICSTETLVLTIASRLLIKEDDIRHSHRRENFESYVPLTGRSP
jgi:hypothetical protein